MAHHVVRARDRDSLARFLGLFSIGLGTAQVAAPKALCRLVGAEGDGRAPTLMRLLGVRELTQGTGILARPRPTGWVWSRVAGDALDLALLGLVAAKNPSRRARTAFAIGNVLMVAVPDVFESLHLTRKQGPARSGQLVRKAVTIRKPQAEVEAAWKDAKETRNKVADAKGKVRFERAPGDRGTELVVEYVEDPPFGDFGVIARKLSGRDLATQLSDDLRRLKQQLETGVVVRSDSTPSGHDLANHLKQRAAQPVEEAVR